jgi:hypothetical protein
LDDVHATAQHRRQERRHVVAVCHAQVEAAPVQVVHAITLEVVRPVPGP